MSELIVETQAGKVCGKKESSCDSTGFYAFKGIPYAQPPVGELRFKDPQPVKAWSGIREATNHGPSCAQIDYVTRKFVGSDDCLYLNIYARSIDPKQGWPVMVWIYGGAFVAGTGDVKLYGPDYFINKNVVLVTINYRLGVLGFLNLEDEVATGNQGLKDQVMALQWVRDNIANFGGDPGNVTIFGESAGSASVHYLTLSPLGKGLFHKVIMQSGVVLNPWAIQTNIKERAYRLCKKLGHTNTDPKSIVEFLRTVGVQKLIDAQEGMVTNEEKIQFTFAFGPSIDSKSKNPYMPVNLHEVAAKGVHVPSMIGYTSREGLCFFTETSEILDKCSLDTSDVLPCNAKDSYKIHYNLDPEDVMQIYFNGKSITNKNPEGLVDYIGDMCVIEGVQRAIKIQVEKKCPPTYVYQFSYDKEQSILKMMSKVQMSGASHGDELEFLFRPYFFDDKVKLPKKGSSKYKIREQIIELWVNFATTGNPTPNVSELIPLKWQPVDDKSGIRYLNIGENLRMEVAPDIAQQYAARKYPKHVP